MKRFNKDASLNKLDNRNNNKTKRISIIICSILLIEAIIYFSFAKFESNKTYSLINGYAQIHPIPLTEKMITLASKGVSDLEYDGTETLTTNGTSDNNLRYIGLTPNNYVYFNCTTTNPIEMSDTTCEKWRIIGLFNNIENDSGNSSSRVKIIRNESLGKYALDTSDSSINSGWGINQWGESDGYEGSDLMRELNTDYLGNITVGIDGKWYNGTGNKKEANMPSTTLNSHAQSMIETVVWHLGSPTNDNGTYDTNYLNNITPIVSYTRERASTNGKLCTQNSFCNDSVTRTTTWTGKIGLMYTSDYGYTTSGGNTTNRTTCLATSISKFANTGLSDCAFNSWMYKSNINGWTISPAADDYGAYDYMNINNAYYANSFGSYSDLYPVFPSLYLKANISISSGTGTSSKPYKLIIQ